MESHYFKLHWSSLISFNLSNVGEIFWVESKGPYLSLQKEKENFCVVLTYSIKRTSEIRKFHVAVVQQRLRNACAKLFFCQYKHIAFLLLQKLPIVMIQKSGYHGNVMSLFFSLLFLTNTYGRFQFFFKKITQKWLYHGISSSIWI